MLKGSGLLPRRVIFGNPERCVVRISPDGTRIAFLAPVDGVLNLWVAPIDQIDNARPVTAVTDRNLGSSIVWMHDNRHIVFFREQAGDENWRAWRVDLRTTEIRPLTPGPGVRCYVQQSSRHFPSELLIAHNERDKRYFDVYRGATLFVMARTAMSSTCSAAQTVNGTASPESARTMRWRLAL
jgi:Lipoprotein LpqB beta-propeller domain